MKIWQPIDLRLTDRQRRVFEIVEQWARTALPTDALKFAAVQREAAIKSKSDFKELRGSAAFRNALANIGIYENEGKRRTKWILIEASKAPEADFEDYFKAA